MSKYKCNRNAFKSIETEAEAYWLGFLLADGCNVDNKMIRIDIKDVGHLEGLSKLIYPDGDKPIAVRDLGFGAVYYFSCTVNDVIGNLNNHGIVPRKSKIAKLPNIDEKLIRHFIRGVFDGDGCLTYSLDGNYRRYTFSIVGSEDLMLSIKKFIDTDLEINLSHGKHKTIYEIKKRGNISILTILGWLYFESTVFLERKHKKYEDMLNHYKQKKNKKI